MANVTALPAPADWLHRASPREWLKEAMQELREAEKSLAKRDQKAGYAQLRRAAGKALNAALSYEPKPTWGRSYMDHVRALAEDTEVPEQVRTSAAKLVHASPSDVNLIMLKPERHHEGLVEAAKDVVAHGYAVMIRHEGRV
jgi:HEPN domain-containing protein